MAAKSFRKLEISLAGLSYRATSTTIEELAKETPYKVTLEREPGNHNDPNAIAVKLVEQPRRGWQIGYVPRQIAALLAPRLDSGQDWVENAWLTEVDPETTDANLLIHLRSKPSRRAK